MRVLGWYFLNTGHLSWKEFNRKEKVRGGRSRFYWRVNHLDGYPEHCTLDRMALCSVYDDMDHYADHAVELYNTHAAFKKRPAASIS